MWPTWQSSPAIELHVAVITAEEFTPQETPTEPLGIHRITNLEEFSKFSNLIVTTAYVLRFIAKCKPVGNKLRGSPMTQELYQAKLQWVESCQLVVYDT